MSKRFFHNWWGFRFRSQHYLVILLVSLMLSSSAVARQASGLVDPMPENNNPNVEEFVWREGETKLPGYPEEDNLIEFLVHQPGTRFNYFIDKESILFGTDDIIRYTLVVRSKTGGQNVMFEGLRCNTGEYKVYAYGNGKGAFRKARKLVWRTVDGRASNLFRLTLMRDYFCNPHVLNNSPEKVIDQMRYDQRNTLEESWK